jgi:hypothetical protein
VHIPKTGGCSISNALIKVNVAIPNSTHRFAKDIIIPKYPSLAVVRNPYDRLYSIYCFYSRMRDNPEDIPKSLSFEDFILSYEEKFMNNLQGNGDPHAYNQCYDYISNNNKIIVSDIIHFENIEHEFNEFCKKYSIITKLPHINSNPKKTFVNKSSFCI